MIGNPDPETDFMPNYENAIVIADYFFGSLHVIMLFVVSAFMIFSKVRKHRLSTT